LSPQAPLEREKGGTKPDTNGIREKFNEKLKKRY
jgi:hypothetical protein